MKNKIDNATAKPIRSGFKLGMLLQFGGMGPIALLIFQLSALLPLKKVLPGIAAVTLADAFYILIALLGIAGVLKQIKEPSHWFRRINGIIIVYLGISFALMSFTRRVSYLGLYDWNGQSVFAGVLLLTMLNPVTIICFTGVFNAKLMELKLSKKGLFLFGLGTLLSTPVFMTFLAVAGSMGGMFLPDFAVNFLNLVVGVLLIYWGAAHVFPHLFSRSDRKEKND